MTNIHNLTPAQQAMLDQTWAGARTTLDSVIMAYIHHQHTVPCDNRQCVPEDISEYLGHYEHRHLKMILLAAVQRLVDARATGVTLPGQDDPSAA